MISNKIQATEKTLSYSIETEKAEIKQGEETSITLKVNSEEQINVFQAKINYDENIWEEIDESNFETKEGWESLKYNKDNKEFNVINKQDKTNIKILKIKLKAKDNANIENTEITIDGIVASDGNIEFKNTTYSYNNRDNVLNRLNIKIKHRDRVLLLGPSGSGKSTILKLLYRYYEINRESIFINNIDINDYTLKDIRDNISYISQNEVLYTDTIKNNIILDREINDIEYLNICKLTYVNDVIKNSNEGHNLLLEENGINLSGGQRQRIILARSLLKTSSIVLIDEGLNEIDIKLERQILNNIFNYYKDRTFIIISHRLNNLDLFNNIIKLESRNINEL